MRLILVVANQTLLGDELLLSRRYGLDDCYDLAAHGRWVARFPELRRGLKRGFTFYRHHAGRPFANAGLRSERLLVAASPNDQVADNHWLRADVPSRLRRHFSQPVTHVVAPGVDAHAIPRS